MKFKFWGTRGSIPVPGKDTVRYGGNTTCLEFILAEGQRVVVDAGTGIRNLGERLLKTEERVDIHLLMTHVHWDHLLGFPFFYPLDKPSTRVVVDGFHTCMKGLRATFNNKMGDGFFPIQFSDIKAEVEHIDRLKYGSLELGGTVIEPISLQHPQGGYGFRFRENKKQLVFLTDNELTNADWAWMKSEAFIGFCDGADILIHDAQYTPDEIDSREGWGHSDYTSVVELAIKARVKQLILFHHDPTRTDDEADRLKEKCTSLIRQKGAAVRVCMAKEGPWWELSS